jgi:hypothetical protein
MNVRTGAAALLMGVALMSGCRTDPEGTEGVRYDAPQEMRDAPQYPTEPRGVPLPGTPEAAEAAAADTRPTDRLDPDTIPQIETPED